MLEPLASQLSRCRVVLASASPRRRQLLAATGIKDFEIVPSTFEDEFDKTGIVYDVPAYVEGLAEGKANEVWTRLSSDQTPPDLVIGADTVVVLNGRVFEKPKSPAEAERMLGELSGRTHQVFTGVCLRKREKEGEPPTTLVFNTATRVTMGRLPSSVIRAYVATGEPLDKAGAYGIQTIANSFVEGVEGSYDNVVGFPTHQFCTRVYQLYGTPD